MKVKRVFSGLEREKEGNKLVYNYINHSPEYYSR